MFAFASQSVFSLTKMAERKWGTDRERTSKSKKDTQRGTL